MDKQLITELNKLLNCGIWEPEELFSNLYTRRKWHYADIRDAIHYLKTR